MSRTDEPAQDGTAEARLVELPDLPVVARRARVREVQVDPWCAAAFRELRTILAERRVTPTGPAGLTLAAQLEAAGEGLLRAYLPVPERDAEEVLYGGLFTVADHHGHLRTVARTVTALTTSLGPRLDREGERRETYLVGPGSGQPMSRWVTQVAVPVKKGP